MTTESISGGRPASYSTSASAQRGQRRQLGRLEHDAVVGGDRRRQLVRHHVERMVERRDRRDHAVERHSAS